MMRTDEIIHRSSFKTWIATSIAFALLTGACLAIPLVQGISNAPTGYATIAAPDAGGINRDYTGDGLDEDVSGTCSDCKVAKSTDRIPPTTTISAKSIPGVDV